MYGGLGTPAVRCGAVASEDGGGTALSGAGRCSGSGGGGGCLFCGRGVGLCSGGGAVLAAAEELAVAKGASSVGADGGPVASVSSVASPSPVLSRLTSATEASCAFRRGVSAATAESGAVNAGGGASSSYSLLEVSVASVGVSLSVAPR